MRPWYAPSLYGVEGGPLRVKCHSKRLDSSGAACNDGSGWLESSLASFRMRLMVGDLVLKVGRAMVKPKENLTEAFLWYPFLCTL